MARDHGQPAVPRQQADDVLGHPVAEIIALRIAAEIVERQNRDRGPRCPGRGIGRLGRVAPRPALRLGLRRSDYRGCTVADLADEAEAALVQRADEQLVVAGVADRLASGVDAARQRRLRNDSSVPDRLDQLVLADDASAVANQVEQKVEHLRLHVHDLAAAAQLLLGDIELEIGKAKHAIPRFSVMQLPGRGTKDHRRVCTLEPAGWSRRGFCSAVRRV